jgi:hypothetical protein
MPGLGLADVFQGLYFCLDRQYLVPAVVKLVTGNMRGRVLGSHKRATMPIKAPGEVAGGYGQVYVMESAGVRHAVSFRTLTYGSKTTEQVLTATRWTVVLRTERGAHNLTRLMRWTQRAGTGRVRQL